MATKKALLIPADPTKPVRLVDIGHNGKEVQNLQRLVGGYVESQTHPDAEVMCNDRYEESGLPLNTRLVHWQHDVSGAIHPAYGDVVVTGAVGPRGETTQVAQATVSYFRTLQLDRDTRSTDVEVRGWEFGL
jgi:hypothetical protein